MLNNITQKQEESEKNLLNEFKDMDISQSSFFNASGSGSFKVSGSGNFRPDIVNNKY